ncbi:MAG: hypothetical protein BWY49_00338 [Candidatus Omnitrophica bacterium ADurb.Bin314]|nr:MAG: hypothetical protein BWY49_00338 [Candidatus Omnitrophica bacterium ADurb.Bin314]
MFCLGQQVAGHEIRVGGVVRDDRDLARSGDHVDVNEPVDLTLRFRDVGIPRSDDLVDLRDRFGTEGHGADRLDAADTVNLVHAEQVRDREDVRVDVPRVTPRRGADCDLLHVGDLGRDNRHVDRRDKGRRAGRDVHADSLNRFVLFPELDAVLAGELEGAFQFLFIVFTDVLGDLAEERDERDLDFLECTVDVALRDRKPFEGQVDPVEFAGVAAEREIPRLTDLREDPVDLLEDLRVEIRSVIAPDFFLGLLIPVEDLHD